MAWLLTSLTFAAEGMVSVLEAPLFRRPYRNSSVIQYVHQDEIIYIHPLVLVDQSAYGNLPEGKKLGSDDKDDPFSLTEDIENYHEGSEFVLTKDNLGRDAWILREHVHIWYEDPRELSQKTASPDNTDYRLMEPLPDGYPIARLEKNRGSIALSLTSPQTTNYRYNQRVTAEGYGNQFELNAQLLRVVSRELSGRWYAGGLLSIRTAENEYRLESRSAQEQWTRLGAGGVISYDAWRSEKSRITIKGFLLAYPLTQVTIRQNERASGDEEIRQYRGWNSAARLETQWTRIKFFQNLDFTLGLWSELESPMELEAKTSTNRPQWWGEGKGDSFSSSIAFTFAGVVGLQSSY
jgi:hypothetical protein